MHLSKARMWGTKCSQTDIGESVCFRLDVQEIYNIDVGLN